MISDIVFALGLIIVLEGLVFALAPRTLEQALKKLAEMPVESRKLMGLFLVAAGVFVVWIARTFLS